ncbi:MAG: PilZ domain-containing protein [Deltaproteobacteria bacterium]|nr:PilZ domain-containing protein [Deltaproteobacteria bacterium]
MANCFVFIGEPGPDAKDKLGILESNGTTARRVGDPADVNAVVDLSPIAIVIQGDLPMLGEYVVALRERRELSRVPVIARLSRFERSAVEHAFRGGCDDIIVDSKLNQFQAMAAVITQHDDWQSMRAPAGLVVLAHQDRYTRMRIGQVLRKNGFDLHFAASTDELVEVIDTKKPRAVITAADLPPRSPVSYSSTMDHQAPWIVLATTEQMALLETAVEDQEDIKFLDSSSDAESLTFVLNDFLAPRQKAERRSPRILYGTTVAFWPKDGSAAEEFLGFTYNVNIGGLFVRTLTPPPMQSVLYLRFSPPFGLGSVVMTAQVVWRKAIGTSGGAATPEGMGVQFVEAMPADLAGFEGGYNALRENQDKRKAAYTSKAPEDPTYCSTSVIP